MITGRQVFVPVVVGLLSCLGLGETFGQVRYEINFPDMPGYTTLVCDLHMHTVFSDGQVWPTVRVTEAWRQGIDVISITDHIEYQPHKEDLPTNHGRPYELASGAARTVGLLLAKGTEITRDTPPGHFNAVFVNDILPVVKDDFLESVRAANGQGGFVFWNHQGWKGEEKGAWLDIHATLFDEGLFQGMEVCNGDSYYPTAHRWCLEKNLAMLGTSDIHDADTRLRSTADNHRTLTLVFAKERTLESVKEALLSRRSLVWYKEQLIGREPLLTQLFEACVVIAAPTTRSARTAWLPLHNRCPMDLVLENQGAYGPAQIELPAHATAMVRVDIGQNVPIVLDYKVTNFVVAPNEYLSMSLAAPTP